MPEDAEFYQYLVDGKEKRLPDMTREELLRALMSTIDVLTTFRSKLDEAEDGLNHWERTGEAIEW